MLTLGLVLVGVAAVVHVYIFVLESLRWTHPATRRAFGVRSAHEAEVTKPLAVNQGFYNLFLAVGAAAGITAVALGHEAVGMALIALAAGSMAAAAAVLLATRPAMWQGAAIQGASPALGTALVAIALAG